MHYHAKAISLLFVITLSACTTNRYTGDRQAGKAATYGAGAAIACALVGALSTRVNTLETPPWVVDWLAQESALTWTCRKLNSDRVLKVRG